MEDGRWKIGDGGAGDGGPEDGREMEDGRWEDGGWVTGDGASFSLSVTSPPPR
jgi:hypothetical protein